MDAAVDDATTANDAPEQHVWEVPFSASPVAAIELIMRVDKRRRPCGGNFALGAAALR